MRATGLCDWLRRETRQAHLACEAAMDLDSRLAWPSKYAELLRSLHGAYATLAADAHALAAEALLGQSGELRSDLSRLQLDLTEPRDTDVEGAECLLTSLEEGVGSIYVMAGSRLGGQVITRAVRARLPGAPVAFFSGGETNPGPGWRALKLALDDWGETRREQWASVLVGADKAFGLVEAALGTSLNHRAPSAPPRHLPGMRTAALPAGIG